MENGNSPYRDAIRALEEIRDYCERRRKSYEGWGSTPVAHEYDLKQVHDKASCAIKKNTPRFDSKKEL